MQKDLIYDVGFHRGEDTEFYLAKGFKVVAIEAHPELYQCGLREVCPRDRIRKLAVVERCCRGDFRADQLF